MTTYVLDIRWDKPGLPRHVGPFNTESEAVAWGELNIPNGSWSTCPVTYPYARSTRRVEAESGV